MWLIAGGALIFVLGVIAVDYFANWEDVVKVLDKSHLLWFMAIEGPAMSGPVNLTRYVCLWSHPLSFSILASRGGIVLAFLMVRANL